MAAFWTALINAALVFCIAANGVDCARTSHFFFDRFFDAYTDPSRSFNSQALTDQAKRTGSASSQAGTWYLGKRSGNLPALEANGRTNSPQMTTQELSEDLFRSNSVPTHLQGWQPDALSGNPVNAFPQTARGMYVGGSVRNRRKADKPKVVKEKPTWYLGKRSSQLESSALLHRHMTPHRTVEKPIDQKAPWYLG